MHGNCTTVLHSHPSIIEVLSYLFGLYQAGAQPGKWEGSQFSMTPCAELSQTCTCTCRRQVPDPTMKRNMSRVRGRLFATVSHTTVIYRLN